MALSPVTEDTMLAEAIRVGKKSASIANRHMQISSVAVDAIHQALEFLKSGRATQARDRLDRALVAITNMSKP